MSSCILFRKVKQIAGRAGRRNSMYPHGEVTCRDPNDMDHLRKCMTTEIEPLQKAGLIPTPVHIALFTQLLNQYGSSKRELELHETLGKFADMATLKGDFFLCRKRSMEVVSRWLKDISNLSTVEKFMLCMSPVVSVEIKISKICAMQLLLLYKLSSIEQNYGICRKKAVRNPRIHLCAMLRPTLMARFLEFRTRCDQGLRNRSTIWLTFVAYIINWNFFCGFKESSRPTQLR